MVSESSVHCFLQQPCDWEEHYGGDEKPRAGQEEARDKILLMVLIHIKKKTKTKPLIVYVKTCSEKK